jgi:hypothetical protein
MFEECDTVNLNQTKEKKFITFRGKLHLTQFKMAFNLMKIEMVINTFIYFTQRVPKCLKLFGNQMTFFYNSINNRHVPSIFLHLFNKRNSENCFHLFHPLKM